MNSAAGTSDERVVPPLPPSSSPTTRELLDALPGRWCLLRDTDVASDDGTASEIEHDVLVGASPDAVRGALVAAGAYVRPGWGIAPHRQFEWWDAGCDRPVRLDLVDRLAFGEARQYELDVVDAVLAGVELRDGWPRPSRSDEQWLALLHALLDRPALRPRDIRRLTPWQATSDSPVVRDLPHHLVEQLGAAAAAGDWSAVCARRPEIERALADGRRATAVRAAWRRALARTSKLQRAVLRPGVRIALLGPDGAGKSTTIRALVDAGVVHTSVYLGVAPATRRRAGPVPGLGLVRTILRLGAAWARATAHRRRGRSVALDRHPLEATIGPPTSKRRTRLRRRLLASVLPRPEVVVVLTAPAEVLHRRKPEHDLAEVKARRERYLALADARNHPVIDTTSDLDEVVRRIRREIHAARARS